MSDENLLSMSAFQEATGASASTVGRWLKSGLPCQRIARPGGGRATVFFDKVEALGWAVAHGNQTAKRKAIALARSTPGTEADAKPSTPELPADDEGLLPALDRLKKQELASHRLLIRLKAKGELNSVLAVQETHLAEVKALAVLENAAVQFRVRSGELVEKTGMQAVYGRIIVSVKNAVLGIPSSAVPLVMPYLKDPEKAHDIFAVLDRLCRAALQAASDRHSRPKPPV